MQNLKSLGLACANSLLSALALALFIVFTERLICKHYYSRYLTIQVEYSDNIACNQVAVILLGHFSGLFPSGNEKKYLHE